MFNHLESACWYKLLEQPKHVENTEIKALSDQEKHKAQNPPEDFCVQPTDSEHLGEFVTTDVTEHGNSSHDPNWNKGQFGYDVT